MRRERVIVYGLGNFFDENKEKIMEQYILVGGIDRNKQHKDGIRIISVSEINNELFDKIIIMIMNIQESIKISKELKNKHNVNSEKICFGISIFFGGNGLKTFDSIDFTSDEKLLLTLGETKIKVSSEDEYNNICEVLINGNYEYYINNDKRDVVVDIGLNVGGATLFFLQQKKVEKVYGYEPFKETFDLAKENLKDFLNKSEKLEIYQCGISNITEFRTINYNKNMSCGQSTLDIINKKNEKKYLDGGYIAREDSIEEKIEVKEAASILFNILKKHPENNIVLKIDCEGEEYNILENLAENGLLEGVKFIMLEWHYMGKERLFDCLNKANFSYWSSDKMENMGLIYAYK